MACIVFQAQPLYLNDFFGSGMPMKAYHLPFIYVMTLEFPQNVIKK